MTKTLKSMTAAECSTERSKHRNAMSFLALERMRLDTTVARKAQIDAEVLVRRRRTKRLDRQIAIVRAAEQVTA